MLPNAGLLNAEILLYEQHWDRANPLMNQIEDKIVALPGPDDWCEALFELDSIAQTARQVGDWELAESTSQKMIAHDPSYADGHYMLSLVATHRGDASTAKQEFAAAEKLWSDADPDVRPAPAQNQ